MIAPHVRDRFKSLVAALEDEVERPFLEEMEFIVILNDHGLVAASCVFARFNQQVEPLLGRVIGDAFVARIPMRQAKEPVGFVGPQVA